MLTRAEKEKIVSGIKDNIQKSDALFLTNLIGVTANDSVDIRKKVRDAKGKIVITRNTLFRRASEGTYAEELLKNIKGPHAIAFSFEDAAAVAKAIYDAGEENEIIDLKGGFLGEKALSRADIVQLAKLPSRDQMLATLLATFNAPVSAFVRVMEAIRAKKEEGGEAPVEAAAAATEEAPAATEETAEPASDENKDENKE
ncbi:MAG: 50S ribosomal protein L10 [Halobacteriovoraceae bacterium]|nr:50S ribosomal protein L10 [Halobacteriovoraceae bacterium]